MVFGQAVYTAELCAAVGALANYAKSRRVAWSVSLKLATFLSSHDVVFSDATVEMCRIQSRGGPGMYVDRSCGVVLLGR